MQGKSTFTKQEAEELSALIKQKLNADSIRQKAIRNKIRALGFYASDFGLSGGYTVNDFLKVVRIIGNLNPVTPSSVRQTKTALEPERKTTNSTKEIFGLPPVSNNNAKVLILGTMPGADSLKLQQYYGNSRNNFWKLMEAVLEVKAPESYPEKIKLLLKSNIALWDVCKSCIRQGSLDTDIKDEVPNDLVPFLKEHSNIRLIAFNGKEAEKKFKYHFKDLINIETIQLPSTSPANAQISWEVKAKHWQGIKTFIE